MSNETPTEELAYLSVPALKLSTGKPLPCSIYLCLNHRMVKYRNADDPLEQAEYDKLIFNKVKYVFIEDTARDAFQKWTADSDKADAAIDPALLSNPDTAPIAEAAIDQRRAMMDIFMNPKNDRQVRAAVEISKRLVNEFMRKPFAINNIQQLQRYSKGAVDHSVNVSLLCVFLGLRMGYSHQLILENLAMGGLFHDIGKTLIEPRSRGEGESESLDEDPDMQKHPALGRELLDTNKDISNEVKLMVAQHHEYLDGSGYPARLKGLAVYDLARLVAIANTYDNLVTQSTQETIAARCEEAIERLGSEFEGKLDPKKLEKALKILRYSFL